MTINNRKPIDQVSHNRYLASWLNNELTRKEKMKARIEIARKDFNNYIWSILLCVCESWTLKSSLR